MYNFTHTVQWEHFQNGGSMKEGIGNSVENWPYLGKTETVRYGQGYYQSLIGSGVLAFK